MIRYFGVILGLIASTLSVYGQGRVETIPYGDFERWVTRNIKESAILGGNITQVYAIGPMKTIDGAMPYRNMGGSPWGCSNALAIVMGMTKTTTTVFPERRGDGMCARLDTKLLKCKVLGMIDISVTVSGTVYLGEVLEPIRNTNDPYSKIDMGMPFTKRPTALQIDYKANIAADKIITKASGMSSKVIVGDDYADVFLCLQKRWEDSDGKVYAKRIGTARYFFDKTVSNWVNGFKIPIKYGDLSNSSQARPYLGLRNEYYTRNSKGRIVPIREIGWADENEIPTHIILLMSSGNRGAYEGALGNNLWLDNIKLLY